MLKQIKTFYWVSFQTTGRHPNKEPDFFHGRETVSNKTHYYHAVLPQFFEEYDLEAHLKDYFIDCEITKKEEMTFRQLEEKSVFFLGLKNYLNMYKSTEE